MARTPAGKQSEFQRRNRVGAVASGTGPAAAAALAKAGFADPALLLRWAEIAGPDVARLALPLRLGRQGVLTLLATPGAALFLAHEKRQLAERINAYLGQPAVTRITFVQGPRAARPLPEGVEKKRGGLPLSDPARTYLGPDRLKTALENLARRRNLQG
jgi:hypothetical protein